MPIRPENRALYPTNWASEIRPRILARAGNRCEKCKAPNGETIWRGDAGVTYMLPEGDVFDSETGERLGSAKGSEYRGDRFVRIVLTIAHLHDPNPANCSDENLAALCQRCHLRHDAKQHAETARATRRSRKACGELFV